MKRDKDGNVIWPKPSRGLRLKSLHATKAKYQEAGMWRETDHEKEFWGLGRPLLADRDLADLSGPHHHELHTPNAMVKKEGWCVECKEHKDECACDESEVDLMELFGD